MPAFIRTQHDEHLWSKAKARAAAEGKAEQWPYITGIFKHMKGGSVNKSAMDLTSFARELIKQAEDDRGIKEINWKKLLGFAALSGAAMGATKGLGEKWIEKKIVEKLAKHPTAKIPLRAHLPWIGARGVTGGVGASVGAGSMALGLKKSKEKKK
jgi:hypothetical protein